MSNRGEEKGCRAPVSPIKGSKYNNYKNVNLRVLHKEIDRLMAETKLFLNQLEEHHDRIMEELGGDEK